MVSITIYGDAISGNCRKIRYLGLAFTWQPIDIMKGESRTPAFLALNPAGQVPVVVLADGRPLAQSNAILLHLAEGSPLIPGDAYQRAKMLEWLFWEQYSHEPTVAVCRFRMRYQGQSLEQMDVGLLTKAKAALHQMETHLVAGDGPFLLGNAFSLADIALIAYTRTAPEGGLDLTDYPALRNWIGRVEKVLDIDD